MLRGCAQRVFSLWRNGHGDALRHRLALGISLPEPTLVEGATSKGIKVRRAEKNWSQAEPSLPLGMRVAKPFGVRVEDVFGED